MNTKDDIRNKMKSLRREYRNGELSSEKIVKSIVDFETYRRAECVCTYMPLVGEADISEIFSDAVKRGKTVCVPVVLGDCELAISVADVHFKKGRFGILEPENPRFVDFSEPDFILVPGLAFDFFGNRLGFGKGYYDRFLSSARGFKLGVCFSFQVENFIPHLKHDISVDALVTENELRLTEKVKNTPIIY